jgi:hypothetical protein
MDPMREYNKQFCREIDRCNREYIRKTPQPTMMGGGALRAHPLPGYTTSSSYPDSLSTGKPVPRGRLSIPDGQYFHVNGGKGFSLLKGVTKGIGSLAKDIALPVAKELGKDMLKTGIKSALTGGRRRKKFNFGDLIKTVAPIAAPILMGMGRPKKRGAAKCEQQYPESVQGGNLSGGGRGRQARNDIVKRIMKEKGLKLIEASKYVKAHNLY